MTTASLGLAINSAPAARAAADLDQLTVSAGRAETATVRMGRSGSAGMSQFARVLDEIAFSSQQTNVLLTIMAERGTTLGTRFRQVGAGAQGAGSQVQAFGNHAGKTGQSLANLSFQINDIASGLAMGQSPFTILAQQGGQVFQIYQQNNNVFREAGRVVTSLLTPTRLLTVGIVGAGVAATAAAFSWKSFALALDDTARRAGTTSSEMAKLQAAASFKGIGQDEFAGGIARFSEQVYQARNNMGGLADLLRANGQHARTFEDAFGKVADLIKNARDDQQRLVLLQQAGLPATMEWVRFMSQGAAGVKKATDEAVAFGGAANDNMVKKAREFDEAWNRATTNASLYFRSWGGEAVGWVDKLLSKASQFGKLFTQEGVREVGRSIFGSSPAATVASRFPTAAESFKPFTQQAPTVDRDKLLHDIRLEQPRLALLGSLEPLRADAQPAPDQPDQISRAVKSPPHTSEKRDVSDRYRDAA